MEGYSVDGLISAVWCPETRNGGVHPQLLGGLH